MKNFFSRCPFYADPAGYLRKTFLALSILSFSCSLDAENLNNSTYWFGNTWGGGSDGKMHMRMNLQDIFVLPDGTVATNASWEEHRGSIKLIKEINGEPELIAETTWNDHFATSGLAVTADADYIYATVNRKMNIDGVKYRRHFVARYNHDLTPAGFSGDERGHWREVFKAPEDHILTPEQSPAGMAVAAGKLYLSDPYALETSPHTKQIKVFRTSDMASLGGTAFNLDATGTAGGDLPRKITVDNDGFLWIVQEDAVGAFRVRKYSTDGVFLGVEINKSCIVSDVAFGMIDGVPKILITDADRHYVRRFTDLNNPYQDKTYCRSGGVFGTNGGSAGETAQDRLWGPTGVGVDADGNVYIGTQGGSIYESQGGGVTLRKFKPAGGHRWTMEGLHFLDKADVDPDNDTTVYTQWRKYELAYSLQTDHMSD